VCTEYWHTMQRGWEGAGYHSLLKISAELELACMESTVEHTSIVLPVAGVLRSQGEGKLFSSQVLSGVKYLNCCSWPQELWLLRK